MSTDRLIEGVPSHWFGAGCAPQFNRGVAQASEQVTQAEADLLETMRASYPLGRRVTVFHHRGQFPARVMGWDVRGVRVAVENTRTLKVSKWWAAQVQLESKEPT